MSENEKRYSDKELRKVIETALVLQQQETLPAADGIAESELISMAKELGIKEKYLLAAIENPQSMLSTKTSVFLGGPTKQEKIIFLDTIPEKLDLLETLSELPEILKMRGSGTVIDGQINWKSDSMTSYQSGISSCLMGYETRDGKFKIEIKENYGLFAGAIHGGIGGGLGIGVGVALGVSIGVSVLGSVLFSTLFPLGILAGSYLLSRGIFKAYTNHRKKTLQSAIGKLKRKLGQNQRNS